MAYTGCLKSTEVAGAELASRPAEGNVWKITPIYICLFQLYFITLRMFTMIPALHRFLSVSRSTVHCSHSVVQQIARTCSSCIPKTLDPSMRNSHSPCPVLLAATTVHSPSMSWIFEVPHTKWSHTGCVFLWLACFIGIMPSRFAHVVADHRILFFVEWILLQYMYAPYFLYPLICGGACRLFPLFGSSKRCCSAHGVQVSFWDSGVWFFG